MSVLVGSYTRRLDRSDWNTLLAREWPGLGMSEMRSANARSPSTDRWTTAYSAERQEMVRRGLRILARMIARAHLRRQAARSLPAPRLTAEDEDGD